MESSEAPTVESATVFHQFLVAGGQIDRLTAALADLNDRVHAASGTMTAATLNAAMLTDGSRSAAEAEAGEALRESLRHLRRTIEELKRAIREARLGEVAPFQPAAALAQVVMRFRERFGKVRWEIRSNGRIPDECHTHGGADAFCEVAGHLLANAAEGRDGRGAAHVVAVLGFDYGHSLLHLDIHDDGPGFLWSPPSGGALGPRSTKPGHLGLGLLTCHQLARLSGGSLSVTSPAGGGSIAVATWGVASPAEVGRESSGLT